MQINLRKGPVRLALGTALGLLKEQSYQSISNVKSAHVRLATGISTATSLVNDMKSV